MNSPGIAPQGGSVPRYLCQNESRPCACGGKVALTPSLKLTHEATRKHREWMFRRMCVEFLDLTEHREKVAHLKVMKTIVCV